MTRYLCNKIQMLVGIGHLYFSSSSLAYLLRCLFPRNQLVLRSYVLHLISQQISTEIAATVRLTKPPPFHKFMAHSAACIQHEAIVAPARTATADISLRLLADSIELDNILYLQWLYCFRSVTASKVSGLRTIAAMAQFPTDGREMDG
jgi:hypothetical protein